MNVKFIAVIAIFVVLALCMSVMATDKEQELINQFFKKSEVRHIKKLGWVSAGFSVNRVNRNNEYNAFANSMNNQLDGGSISWLGSAKAFNVEFGTLVTKNIMWSLGGEYWLKMGQSVGGSVTYTPTGGTPTTLTNPSSEIKTSGVFTGLSYYVKNAPKPAQPSNGISAYVGGTVGFYQMNWELFPQYQNLNLSTTVAEGESSTFKGSAPGFSANFGVEYPINFGGLVLTGEASYLHLNFTNVGWYNSVDQEIVATYGNTATTRVDVALSGVRGKINLKKYFSW